MMKKIGLLAIIITSCLNACPTCVGKIAHNSPPFFSDSFYAPELKKQANSNKIEQETAENEQESAQDGITGNKNE